MFRKLIKQARRFNPFIKVLKVKFEGAIFEKHGNCIDIKTGKTYIPNTNCVGVNYVPLGFKAELPRYYRGVLLLRSSSAKKYNIDMPCGYGEIEWDYAGEWNGIIRTHKSSKEINAGDRVFQFYIEPLWNSPWYIKLIDIFSVFRIEEVDILTTSRGGLGHTGN